MFHDGRAAHSVHELLVCIEDSSQFVYDEHVSKNHNDFAAWIKLGLHNEKLATAVRNANDRLAAILVLRSWLKNHPFETPHFLHKAHQREFIIGMLLGIIIGIILFRIVEVLV